MDTNAVVINPGSATIKAGLASNFPSDTEPRVVTPSIVRDATDPSSTLANGAAAAAAGGNDGDPHLIRAVGQGHVLHWEAFEALLYYVLYQQLGWELGDEGSILFAEPLLFPKRDRERLCQLLFETFNVSALALCDEAVLSLYSVGRLTGTVVDVGASKIDVCCVTDGQSQTSSMRRLPYGAWDLAEYMGRLLHQGRGRQRVEHRADLEALLAGAGQVCESPEEFAQQMAAAEATAAADSDMAEGSGGGAGAGDVQEFVLPDGQVVRVVMEGKQAGEALAQGTLLGGGGPPLADCIFSCMQWQQDAATRKAWMEALLLCGGGGALPGMPQRVLRDLRMMCPPSLGPALATCPEYMPERTLAMSAWVGGAVLAKVVFAGQQQAAQQAVTKADYEEAGPSAVHRKCC